MTPRETEQLLDKFTDSLAASIGFSRMDKDAYGRPEHDATALLFFPCRLTSRGAAFTARVGLRFKALARWLDDNHDDTMPTVAMTINLLREDKSFTEWEFSIADDLERLRCQIHDDLRAHALPFIERYSRLPDLRKSLESPNKQDWVDAGLSVDSRVTTLAAIQLAEGDRAGAIKTLDDGMKALEESLARKTPEMRKRELRKRGFEMRHLHERLLVNA